MSTTEKKCSACGETKPVDAFGRDGSRKDGREPRCKACRSAKHAATYVRMGYPTSRPSQRKYNPGDSKGDLLMIKRLDPRNGEAWARFVCRCGAIVEKKLGNVFTGPVSTCAIPGRHLTTEPGDYDSAHKHTRRIKGSASQHTCRCGKPADQWAYSRADHDQQADSEGREAGKPFSVNPDHYTAMCRACHKRFDNAHRRMVGDGLSLVHVAYWTATRDQAEAVAA